MPFFHVQPHSFNKNLNIFRQKHFLPFLSQLWSVDLQPMFGIIRVMSSFSKKQKCCVCACNRFFPIFLKNNFSNVKCTVCSTSNPKTNNNNWIRNRAWSPLYQPCTTLLPFNIFQFVFNFFFKFHPIIRSISMASKRVFLFFLLKVSNVSFWPPPPNL